jgi:hypothetical protein
MNQFEKDMIELGELGRRLQILCFDAHPGLATWNKQFSEACSKLYQKLSETKGD